MLSRTILLNILAAQLVIAGQIGGEPGPISEHGLGSPAHSLLTARINEHEIAGATLTNGGVLAAAGNSLLLSASAGQAAVGTASGSGIGLGSGFWATRQVSPVCSIELSGDVNISSTINSTDIIYLVNYVFKSGPEPQPCEAAGDVNCSGGVNSTDIIFLVNYVFKAGPPPCDVCVLVDTVWSCP